MKAKTFLLNVLFFILAITFASCTSNTADEEIGIEENVSVDHETFMIDKDDIQEPDERD
jgi:preprotein translocase subunit SecG